MTRLRFSNLARGITRATARTALPVLVISTLITPLATVTTKPVAAARCAWPLRVSVDAVNVHLPDSAATYWVMGYQVRSDLQITISGTFPDSRYASFNVYDAENKIFTTNGVPSNLPDYQIVPDAGSVNPWQQSATPGGTFTVTLRADAAPGQVNTLPLAPAGTADGSKGSLIFRVYLPADGNASTVELPTLTVTQGGVSTTLATCASALADDNDETAPATATESTEDPAAAADDADTIDFVRTSELDAMSPNADNAYLGAWITPPGPDNVVVIRAKAPRAVTGSHPVPWPRRGSDVRYWSMCTNLEDPQGPVVANSFPDGQVDYGCRYDDNTKLDRSGYYTFVIGTEEQRATIEQIKDVTFLPLSASTPLLPHLVLLRNLLPVDRFSHAVQLVPPDSEPAVAASIMGPYYPRVSVCALANVVAHGAGHCGCGH